MAPLRSLTPPARIAAIARSPLLDAGTPLPGVPVAADDAVLRRAAEALARAEDRYLDHDPLAHLGQAGVDGRHAQLGVVGVDVGAVAAARRLADDLEQERPAHLLAEGA